MPSPLFKKDARHTYGEYLTWTDEERWELIEGVPYCMTPAPATPHQRISGRLFYLIFEYVKDEDCEVFAAPFDVRLGEMNIPVEKWETVVQPDISVICDLDKIDDRGCRGAPDWIIEIISPSTASRDHIQKRRLYEKYGVQEYWLVDPAYRLVHIYRLEKGGIYLASQTCSEADQVEVGALPGFCVDLSQVFSQLS